VASYAFREEGRTIANAVSKLRVKAVRGNPHRGFAKLSERGEQIQDKTFAGCPSPAAAPEGPIKHQ
jgi:hypothetical protein